MSRLIYALLGEREAMTPDAKTRRLLRRSLGSRVTRRAGAGKRGAPSARQKLAAKIEAWKREQITTESER
jgi:hypothetical protein